MKRSVFKIILVISLLLLAVLAVSCESDSKLVAETPKGKVGTVKGEKLPKAIEPVKLVSYQYYVQYTNGDVDTVISPNKYGSSEIEYHTNGLMYLEGGFEDSNGNYMEELHGIRKYYLIKEINGK